MDGRYVIGTIDLAQRHSAAVVMTSHGVRTWCGTVDVGPADAGLEARWGIMEPFLAELSWNVATLLEQGGLGSAGRTIVVIEDVHPRAVNSKPAVKLQALVAHRLRAREPRLILPNRWQRHLGYKKVKGRSSKGWAKEVCPELGYQDPEGLNAKQREDVRDATLIAHWVRTTDEATFEKETTIP